MELKLSSRITIFPASFAASVPLPMANPTSARFSAGESLTPSPVIPTTRFSSWQSRTIRDLSVGSALAMTRICGRIFFTSSSLMEFNMVEVRQTSSSEWTRPASLAMADAVSSRSPVIITTWIPAFCTSWMAIRASGLTSSRMAARPISTRFPEIQFSCKGSSEYPNAITRMAFFARVSIRWLIQDRSSGWSCPSVPI